jgi:amino acid transporter
MKLRCYVLIVHKYYIGIIRKLKSNEYIYTKVIIKGAIVSDKKIKLTTLILSGIGTIIGSGWLFGAAHAANIAGPASILSWIIGAVIILILALNLVEILTIAPIQRGSMGYFLKYTHGSFASFLAEWTILIGFISSIPSEAIASTQYLSSWDFVWTKNLYNYQTNIITFNGLIVASILCVVYFILNYYSLSLLSRSIKWITIFKIVIPIITIICFINTNFQLSNFSYVGHNTFVPYGYSGIFSAITMAGIVYAFNGFQAPISFALEAENPRKNVPIAIISSILICACIYIMLQVAFIGSMPQKFLNINGWHNINYTSPFAFLAINLNLNFLTILLYIDAFISPSGGGIVYTALSGRVLSAMNENVPKIISKIDPATKLPKNALYVVLLICFICLWLLPSWNQLAAVISVGYVLCYATVPISTYSFRKLMPNIDNNPRAIRIKGMNLIAPLSFILSSFMLYWSKWPLNGKVILVIFLGIPIYMYYAYKHKKPILTEIYHALWIFCYLIFIAVFGYLGSSEFGGHNIIPSKYAIDHIILATISLMFFKWGYSISHKTKYYYEEINND